MSTVKQTGFGFLAALGLTKTVQEGAATSCYVATSDLIGATSGKFFEDCNAVTILGGSHLHDEAMASRLWQVSEDLTREYLVTYKESDWPELEKELGWPRNENTAQAADD